MILSSALEFENNYKYGGFLNQDNFLIAFQILCYGGSSIKTKKRNMQMYQYGGTIGSSQCPFFQDSNNGHNQMLPRPVISCRPGKYGHRLMTSCLWFRSLVADVQDITMTFLKEDTSVRSKEVLEITKKCLQFMPPSLRICDSIFNSMIVVGDFTGHG